MPAAERAGAPATSADRTRGLLVTDDGQRERSPDRACLDAGSMMDEKAFDDFYAASFRRLVGQIYVMCGDVTEAQDCVQEAFVRAWDKRRTLDTDQSPEAWVRTVAYRLAVSRWRRARRSLHDRAHLPTPPAEPDVTRVALARALQRLSPDQRRAIVLFHLCDLSIADVAAEMGVPTGTVKARLSRGRAALALLLADDPCEELRHDRA